MHFTLNIFLGIFCKFQNNNFRELFSIIHHHKSISSSQHKTYAMFFIENYKFSAKTKSRKSHLDIFLRKGVMKICSTFTEEHPCRSVISLKVLCSFIEIVLRHGCSPVNLLHIFRTSFRRNTCGWLLLKD